MSDKARNERAAVDFSQIFSVAQLANALALASLLTLLASGLALIFGLRDVMNFGHGAFYMNLDESDAAPARFARSRRHTGVTSQWC